MKRKSWIILFVILLALLFSRLQSKNILRLGQFSTPKNVDLSNSFQNSAIEGRPQVQIGTSKGDFVIELRPDLAPKTVTNFLALFSEGKCNNLTFHRVEDWVVQGCDPKGDGTGGELNLPTETSQEPFLAGSLGVARKTSPKNLSNNSQFFILKTDSRFLDNEYTYFGKVISGQSVLNRLSIGDKILSTDILSK